MLEPPATTPSPVHAISTALRPHLGRRRPTIPSRPSLGVRIVLLAVGVALVAALAGCGSAPAAPRVEDPEDSPQQGTPLAIQPCVEREERACGVEYGRHDGVVDCAAGVQICHDGVWGECAVDPLLGVDVVPAERFLMISAQSAPASQCRDNPCNPYCRSFDDAPDGGYAADAGSLAPNLSGGDVGGTNVPLDWQERGQIGSQCAAPCTGQACQEACQFDSRCAGDTCAPNRSDAADGCSAFGGGIDITVPTTCASTSSGGWRYLTVCNRGDAPAPAGIHCYGYAGTAPRYPDANPTGGALLMTTNRVLAPGSCESQRLDERVFPTTGPLSILCNPQEEGIVECNPHNNWSVTQSDPPDECRIMSTATPVVVSRVFTATCAAEDTVPAWRWLSWDSKVPSGGRIDFRFRAFAASPDGTCQALPPVAAGTTAPLAVAGKTDPAVCKVQSSGGTCPKSLAPIASSASSAVLPCLQMDANVVPGLSARTSLFDWLVTYDCRPAL